MILRRMLYETDRSGIPGLQKTDTLACKKQTNSYVTAYTETMRVAVRYTSLATCTNDTSHSIISLEN